MYLLQMRVLGVQVAEVVQGMVEAGHQEAAAELLPELAHSALSMACNILVQLVNQGRLAFQYLIHSMSPYYTDPAFSCTILFSASSSG